MKRILLLALIILVGCGQVATIDPNAGRDGVVLDFIDVRDIFEQTENSFSIEIWNRGATDVEGGILTLNLEKNLFENFENKQIFTLEGKKIGFPQGEKDVVFFEVKTKKISLAERQPTKIKATLCYPYTISFVDNVCIDSNPNFEGEKSPICKSKPLGREIRHSGGQGGPVAITSVITRMIRTSEGIHPQFDFEIENIGKGFAYSPDAVENACSSTGLTRQQIGNIFIDKVALGNEILGCNKPQLRLETRQRGNEYYEADVARLVCRGSVIEQGGTSAGTIILSISYGYKESVEDDFFVEDRKI